MNTRYWGGLALVVLGLGVLLTMGCEKGALGVRSTTLFGTLLDSENRAGVAGARVAVTSLQPTSGGGAQVSLGGNYVTVTDANGRFVFEGLNPDKYILDASAQGYSDLRYPSASATVQSFYVNNGTSLDLGPLLMGKISNPLNSATVSVKGVIIDAKSKDELLDTQVLTIYLDGRKYQNRDVTYAEFKSGLTVTSKLGTYELTVITNNYATYKNVDDEKNKVSGETDNVLNIELTPISYNVRVTLRNKPFYMNRKAIELSSGGAFSQVDRNDKCVLTISTALPRDGKIYNKVLATATVNLDPYEPEAVLSGISLPASLTVLLSGYQEMEFSVPPPETGGTQGVIAMFLNMGTGGTPLCSRDGRSIEQHIITRPTYVTLYSRKETNASDTVPLQTGDTVRIRCLDQQWGPDRLNSFDADSITPLSLPIPCGYIVPFEVYAELSAINAVGHTTNFYYIEPVTVPAGAATPASPATFTANLLIAKDTHVVRP